MNQRDIFGNESYIDQGNIYGNQSDIEQLRSVHGWTDNSSVNNEPTDQIYGNCRPGYYHMETIADNNEEEDDDQMYTNHRQMLKPQESRRLKVISIMPPSNFRLAQTSTVHQRHNEELIPAESSNRDTVYVNHDVNDVNII